MALGFVICQFFCVIYCFLLHIFSSKKANKLYIIDERRHKMSSGSDFLLIYCVALPQLHNLFYCLAFLLLLDMVSAIVKTDPHNYKSSVVSKSQGMLWPIISQNRITSVTIQYLSLCKALDWLLGGILESKFDLD